MTRKSLESAELNDSDRAVLEWMKTAKTSLTGGGAVVLHVPWEETVRDGDNKVSVDAVVSVLRELGRQGVIASGYRRDTGEESTQRFDTIHISSKDADTLGVNYNKQQLPGETISPAKSQQVTPSAPLGKPLY